MNILPLALQIAALVCFAISFFNALPRYNWMVGGFFCLLLSWMVGPGAHIPLHTVGP